MRRGDEELLCDIEPDVHVVPGHRESVLVRRTLLDVRVDGDGGGPADAEVRGPLNDRVLSKEIAHEHASGRVDLHLRIVLRREAHGQGSRRIEGPPGIVGDLDHDRWIGAGTASRHAAEVGRQVVHVARSVRSDRGLPVVASGRIAHRHRGGEWRACARDDRQDKNRSEPQRDSPDDSTRAAARPHFKAPMGNGLTVHNSLCSFPATPAVGWATGGGIPAEDSNEDDSMGR